ncbi:MAG: 6-bladed beta-propeller [Prolixibacteraceae bacterium]|nr:6-bladed beta-propeller [Prolixibacteraceae bacterium]
MTTHKLLISVFSLFICFSSLAQTGNKSIPVIDKNKSYPKKEFNTEAEVIYIPLETKKDILLDRGAHIYYVSDQRILIADWQTCDVFVFDTGGNAISHFNVKDGMGVSMINYAVYDEQNQEIFILGKHNKKVVVYTIEGKFKRTLHLPLSIFIEEIQSFDDSLLLAKLDITDGSVEQCKPYMFISKADGSVVSGLNLTFEKINPSILVTNGVWTRIKNDHSGNCKFGQEYIISNMSSDTIFMLKQDKTLVPIFTQTPTVFSDPPVIVSVGMKTNDFITFAIYPYDLKKAARKSLNGENQILKDEARFIIYEFKTGRFYEQKGRGYWAEKVDISENMGVGLIYPHSLINKLKLGVLKGKLEELATKLKIDDNPVVEIVRFK